MKKLIAAAGVAAPLVYLATVLVGGAITPGYSHVAQAISELVETGAPYKPQLDISFAVYNVLLLVFAVGLYLHVRSTKERLLAAGALALAGVPLFSLLMAPFAMDPVGAPATFTGMMHWVLAGLVSLLTIVAVLLCGLGFRRRPGAAGFGLLSVVIAAVIFVTGGGAAAGTGLHLSFFGVLERLTIGSFEVWVFLAGLKLWPKAGQVGSEARQAAS